MHYCPLLRYLWPWYAVSSFYFSSSLANLVESITGGWRNFYTQHFFSCRLDSKQHPLHEFVGSLGVTLLTNFYFPVPSIYNFQMIKVCSTTWVNIQASCGATGMASAGFGSWSLILNKQLVVSTSLLLVIFTIYVLILQEKGLFFMGEGELPFG